MNQTQPIQSELFPLSPRARPAHRRPELKLFVNENDGAIAEHRLARCVYAETLAASLPAVEALCAMVKNTGRPIAEIARDENVFESLRRESERHAALLVKYDDIGLEMCLRAVRRMLCGNLPDLTRGATRFHRDDQLPEWATALGSIAEIGNLLFYI
ncbi:MAG: cell wall hydrolase [Rickettsiales bacterium]|jgi:hypothetical protein|nr:cell wall hydrolase [Rickettsiales bacterium]